MIKPTIGRVVLYRPHGINGPTLPAIICHVWNDQVINIAGFTSNGAPLGATSVRLDQGQEIDEWLPRCEWMPSQIAQDESY